MTRLPEHLWFLNSWVIVRVSSADGQDEISVIEHRVRNGDSPPLHRHRTEDEVLHILDGEFRLVMGDQERRAVAGDMILVPKGVPHTYRVESSPGGRVLTVTVNGDFERFVRAVSRPAERHDLPPPSGAPSAEAIAALASMAAQFGIEFVGPALH